MALIRVAIDTSVLRRDPRLAGGGFEALARLAEADHVEIFIPDVVAQEFVSLPAEKAEAVTTLQKALTILRRAAPESFSSPIDSFEAEVLAEFKGVEATAKQVFDEWVKR